MGTKIVLHCLLLAELLSPAWAAPKLSGGCDRPTEPPTSAEELDNLLQQFGGRPGNVPATIENQEPDTSQCFRWFYEYTNILNNTALRYEYASVSYGNEGRQLLDISGEFVYFGSHDEEPFLVMYSRYGYNNSMTIQLENYCGTEDWGVFYYYNEDKSEKIDYVVHGNQELTYRVGLKPDLTTGDFSLGSPVDDNIQINWGMPEGLNASKLLEHFGGLPGNFTGIPGYFGTPPSDRIDSSGLPNFTDPNQRPFPDVPTEETVYNQWGFWLPFAIRIEHASVRFTGKEPTELLDLCGVLYWRSGEGDYRIEYRQDDTGFHSHVDTAECDLVRGFWKCLYSVSTARGDSGGGLVPVELLLSLVGGK